jgi:hypothetical protein
MSTVQDIAAQMAEKHGDTMDEALRVVTAYANDLGISTGAQSGGQAPDVEIDAENVDHIVRAYAEGHHQQS